MHKPVAGETWLQMEAERLVGGVAACASSGILKREITKKQGD